jgi:hypothetical protein
VRSHRFDSPTIGLEKPPGYPMLLAAKHTRMALECGFTRVIGAATGPDGHAFDDRQRSV